MANERAFTVRLSASTYDDLTHIAQLEERSMGQIVRRALRDYCDEVLGEDDP